MTHTLREAAGEVAASAWRKVKRTFRDGHVECRWGCELRLLRYGPDKPVRAISATSDRATRAEISAWYLTTNLYTQQAPLAHVVRLYGLRKWIEQDYKQMKHELGWANFMVRSDRAIRRHWTLVLCSLTFCWWHEAHQALVGASGDARACAKKNRRGQAPDRLLLAARAACCEGLAGAHTLVDALLARVLRQASASRACQINESTSERPGH